MPVLRSVAMATTMRAAVARDGGLALESLPRDEPGPGEVRVRVEACGICGSDLHLFHAGMMAPGVAPGHEIAGVVDALGDGVTGLATGERVAVEPLSSCGACDYCDRGLDALCPESQVFGVHRHGGMAESVTVPARRLFRLPAAVSPEVAALTEPVAVCVHGLRRGGFAPGQNVLVLGAGTIGLLAVKTARALGAGEVWITARHPHQAERARHLGATRALPEADATPEALAGFGREVGFDLVVETVGGAAETLRDASLAVRRGGTVSVLGLFLGDVTLPALTLFLKEASVVWSNCYAHPREDADFERAASLVAEHRGELAALCTHRVPLRDVASGFALAADKKSGAVKVTVLPQVA